MWPYSLETADLVIFTEQISNAKLYVLCSAATEKQVFDQVNIRLFSQLITGISSVLEKLLIYFNGTIISTCFVLLFPVCPVICCLNLNEILLLLSAKKLVITLLLFKVVSSL